MNNSGFDTAGLDIALLNQTVQGHTAMLSRGLPSGSINLSAHDFVVPLQLKQQYKAPVKSLQLALQDRTVRSAQAFNALLQNPPVYYISDNVLDQIFQNTKPIRMVVNGKEFIFPPMNFDLRTQFNLTKFKLAADDKDNKDDTTKVCKVVIDKKNPATEYDPRSSPNIAKFQDQGTCGSCVLFASAGVIHDAFARLYQMSSVTISPMDFLSTKSDVICKYGTQVQTMIADAIIHGVATTSCCEYNEFQGLDTFRGCCSEGKQLTFFPDSMVIIKQFHKMNDKNVVIVSCDNNETVVEVNNVTESINIVKNIVLAIGSLVVGINVTNSFMAGWNQSEFGLTGHAYIDKETYGVDPKESNVLFGGHALTLVGWKTVNTLKYGEMPCWIVRNSWSYTSELKGYFYMPMFPHNEVINFDLLYCSLNVQHFGGMAGCLVSYEGVKCSDREMAKNCPKMLPNVGCTLLLRLANNAIEAAGELDRFLIYKYISIIVLFLILMIGIHTKSDKSHRLNMLISVIIFILMTILIPVLKVYNKI